MRTIRAHVAALALVTVVMLGLSGVRAGDGRLPATSPSESRVRSDRVAPTFWQIEEREEGVLKKPALNVKWQAELGNRCISNPVIANGLVWVGTDNSRPRDRAHKGSAGALMCFRESDGQFLWQYLSPRLKSPFVASNPPGLYCSPYVDGDRLYFTTNRGEVICLDVEPLQQGKGKPKVLWKLDMIQKLKVSRPGHGCRGGRDCSIVGYRDWIYVTTNHGRAWWNGELRHPQAPSLICLEKSTGRVVWTDNSPGKGILGSQWSSPLVAEVKGKPQVIVGQGDGWARAFDPTSGKLIWKFDTNPKSAKRKKNGQGDRYSVIATPVFYRGMVYVGNGLDPESGRAEKSRLYCIDPTKTGDVSPEIEVAPGKGRPNPNSAQVWCFAGTGNREEDQMHGLLDSVGVGNGLIIAPDGNGWIHCLDAKTGKKYWTFDALTDLFSAPLVLEDKVYVNSWDGSVFILAAAKTKKLIALREDLQSLRTSPVMSNGSLYLAADSWLTVIRGLKDPLYLKRPPGK